jgi:hypothetical protein
MPRWTMARLSFMPLILSLPREISLKRSESALAASE